jgi:excisionase family DNA binding protein
MTRASIRPSAVHSGLEPLLSIEDLAEYLGVPVTTIYDWRVDGKGPCGVCVGRNVKFTRSDVLA